MTIATGQQIAAALFLKTLNANGYLELADSTTLTIASGVVTMSQNFHRIDTESAAASDDLDTITLGSGFGDGCMLVIRPANSSRTVVVKHNTGNILTPGGFDISLDDAEDMVILMYDGNLAKWMALPARPKKLTGDVVQVVYTETGAVATGTTATPNDDTIPQNTEGDQYMTLAITPTNASNILVIEAVWNGAASAASNLTVALHKDTAADALAAVQERIDAADSLYTISMRHMMVAGSASAMTFKVRAGGTGGVTITFNGFSTARKLGGVLASSIKITEIQV